MSKRGKCPMTPDGKHKWMEENKFQDKCIYCGETIEKLAWFNLDKE